MTDTKGTTDRHGADPLRGANGRGRCLHPGGHGPCGVCVGCRPVHTGDVRELAFVYGAARRTQLMLRRAYSAFRCDDADPPDVVACYFGLEDEIANWCASCQQRQPLYHQWRAALKAEKAALKQLQKKLVTEPARPEEWHVRNGEVPSCD